MLGILPAPKAATGDERNASTKRDTKTNDPALNVGFAILKRGFGEEVALNHLLSRRSGELEVKRNHQEVISWKGAEPEEESKEVFVDKWSEAIARSVL
jgi:hypothetical protein